MEGHTSACEAVSFTLSDIISGFQIVVQFKFLIEEHLVGEDCGDGDEEDDDDGKFVRVVRFSKDKLFGSEDDGRFACGHSVLDNLEWLVNGRVGVGKEARSSVGIPEEWITGG